MPSEDTKILECNIYADLQCIIEKIDGCKSTLKYSSRTKLSKHIPSGFSMSKISSFRSIENTMMYIELKIA